MNGWDANIQIIADCGCWVWIGRHNSGVPCYGKQNVNVRRALYEIHVGEAPEDMTVVTTCGAPWCINPRHLALADEEQARRARGAIAARKVLCKRGHEITVRPNGQRKCNVCEAMLAREKRRRITA